MQVELEIFCAGTFIDDERLLLRSPAASAVGSLNQRALEPSAHQPCRSYSSALKISRVPRCPSESLDGFRYLIE
ncbi:MAG: hypothetical protein SFV81_15985, partial [Pirellulaceae bacterium]|nr:hypothetical protein [Pirellulaceae bacterium]